MYLPLASKFNRQEGSWGDTTTVEGFMHHLRRGDYGTFRLYSSQERAEGTLYRIKLYVIDLVTKQGMGLIPLGAVIGVFLPNLPMSVNPNASKDTSASSLKGGKKNMQSVAPKKNKKNKSENKRKLISRKKVEEIEVNTDSVGMVLVLSYVFYIIVFHSLSNMPLNEELLYGVQARFWMQPNILVFLFAGFGMTKVFSSGMIIPFVLTVTFVSAQIVLNHDVSDQSDNFYMENYGRALLESVPENSLILTNYDQQWTAIRYLQQCLGLRLDISAMNLSMMTYAWFGSYRKVSTLKIPQQRNHFVHTQSQVRKI